MNELPISKRLSASLYRYLCERFLLPEHLMWRRQSNPTQSDSNMETRPGNERGKGNASPKPSRERRWQAILWTGAFPKELTATHIYGDSLVDVRAAARAWLLQQQPPCFGNWSHSPSDLWQQPAYATLTALYAPFQLVNDISASIVAPFPHEKDPFKPSEPIHRYRGRRSKEARSLSTPPPESKETDLASLSSSGESAIRMPPPERKESDHTLFASSISQNPDVEARYGWKRSAVEFPRYAVFEFKQYEEAVAYFVQFDLLIEKGPAYTERFVPVGEEPGLFPFQSVKVTDNEDVANFMLHRGGWHIMSIKFVRGNWPIIFVLGHLER